MATQEGAAGREDLRFIHLSKLNLTPQLSLW